MKRRCLSFFLLLTAVSLVLLPLPVRAAPEISITSTSVQMYFPQALVFSIEAESKAEITDIRLSYQVHQLSTYPVVSEAWPRFTPAPKVKTQWVWDTRKAELPPGARISYWWSVVNEAAEKKETAPKTVTFDDPRYPWQSLSASGATLLWYQGSDAFAQTLLDTVVDVQRRLTQDVSAYSRETKVYIYGSGADLRGAMVFPREWTGGRAEPQHGIVMLGVPPEQLDWGKRALAHEFTHLVVHQLTFGPYAASLPTWLDEGLAVFHEGAPDAYYEPVVKKAAGDGSLISLRSLSSPLSAKTGLAILSYAQSYNVVDFLMRNYGAGKISRLLAVLRDGSTIDEALLQAYGFNQTDLDSSWQESLSVKPPAPAPAGRFQLPQLPLDTTAIVVLIILGTLVALTAALLIERRTWKR
ncbi:MAG: peptidase MA family metallohydrolase [Chloroflexota bacterium]